MARNFARSSSGNARILRKCQDAGVEVEPGQFAVQVAGRGRHRFATRLRGGPGPSRAGCSPARRPGSLAHGCGGTADRAAGGARGGPARDARSRRRSSGRRTRSRCASAGATGPRYTTRAWARGGSRGSVATSDIGAHGSGRARRRPSERRHRSQVPSPRRPSVTSSVCFSPVRRISIETLSPGF